MMQFSRTVIIFDNCITNSKVMNLDMYNSTNEERSIYEKCIEFAVYHPHLFWISVIFFGIIFSFFISLLPFLYLSMPAITFTIINAEGLLLTLISCQAAIIAIVITTTLISIQIYSSNYSQRSSNILREYQATWYFLLFFGLVDILKNRGLPKDLRAIGSLQ